MVLIRAGAAGLVLAALASAACNQSLFDNHGPGGGTGGDAGGAGDGGGVLPGSCPAPCIADAAADFDGTDRGASLRWRYLEDHRDRTWGLMTVGSTTPAVMVGQNALNHITTCKGNEGFAACGKLSDALLISSAGATAAADPAIELTAPAAAVIQISLRVFVPDGSPDQRIRLYRGSREDVLFTGVAAAGRLLEQAIALDALAGDRFLLAVAPTAAGASNVGVQLFAGPTGEVFPRACQLAFEFDGLSGTQVKELCQGAGFESHHYDDSTGDEPLAAIALAAGPYAEQGMGVDLSGARYLQGAQVLDQLGDLTVQLWSLQNTQDTVQVSAWPFSDLDLNVGGGLGIAVESAVTPILDATTSLDPVQNTYIDASSAFSAERVWKFIRVVHAGGTLSVCIDGKRTTTAAVPVGQLKTTLPPYLGKNVTWTPVIPDFEGVIDDVRVLSGALPCD